MNVLNQIQIYGDKVKEDVVNNLKHRDKST